MTAPLPIQDPLLEVRDLRTYYPVMGGLFRRRVAWVRAVDGVSFAIKPGETFGLVGESGCGKTTVGRSIVRLVRPQGGQILFAGRDILRLSGAELKQARGDLQMIFQDPYGSLNPRMTVAEIVGEGLLVHRQDNRREREKAVVSVLESVGLGKRVLDRYPHEFSGGQRQRIGIARALVLQPRLVIGDEPVSALDVSVQSQVLNLLTDLQREYGLTYMLIAHDLGVIGYTADRVGVMYLGTLVELADTKDLFADPRMPYTQALLSAIPLPDPSVRQERIVLQGDVPSPINPPSGCPFRTRCWLAQPLCAEKAPELREVAPSHWAACHFA